MELWMTVSIGLIILWLLWDYKRKNMTGMKSFFAWPLVGTLPATLPYLRDQMKLHNLAINRYGENYRLWGPGILNPRSALITVKPENAKHFLVTNFDNYERNPGNHRFDKLFGKGIFNSNGDNWKFHRHTARSLFTKNSVADMLPHFLINGHKLIKILELNSKNPKKEMNIQDLLFRFTLDSMSEIGFGHSLNSLNSSDIPVPFADAFNRAQETVALNGRNAFLRMLPDKAFDADIELMSNFILDIVRERHAANDFTQRHDLLSKFMSMQDDDGQPFSENYLRDMVLNFFIAGRDTTACLMSWTIYLLTQNPRVEEKLVNLIDKEIGTEDPTVEQLNGKSMAYLKHVLDETLRLYPSVPFDARRAKNADVFPDGTQIPAGLVCIYSALLVGRSEKYWKDAEQFIPERWESKETINSDAVLAFHAGPQTCLGRPMAYLEAKTMIVLLLQHFKIRLAPGHEVKPHIFLVMPVHNGLFVTLEPREK